MVPSTLDPRQKPRLLPVSVSIMQISYSGWRLLSTVILIYVFKHGGKFSQGRRHGEDSCHRAHHCRVSSVLFWHRRPCRGIFSDRLLGFQWDWDRSVGEFVCGRQWNVLKCSISLANIIFNVIRHCLEVWRW